jgi:hypothetical protein
LAKAKKGTARLPPLNASESAGDQGDGTANRHRRAVFRLRPAKGQARFSRFAMLTGDMFSGSFPPSVAFALKLAALGLAICATGAGLYAARLWLQASKVELPEFDPPTASIDDVPALHIMESAVQLNATADALRLSARLNASAAKWTASAAMLGGVAAILGAL